MDKKATPGVLLKKKVKKVVCNKCTVVEGAETGFFKQAISEPCQGRWTLSLQES